MSNCEQPRRSQFWKINAGCTNMLHSMKLDASIKTKLNERVSIRTYWVLNWLLFNFLKFSDELLKLLRLSFDQFAWCRSIDADQLMFESYQQFEIQANDYRRLREYRWINIKLNIYFLKYYNCTYCHLVDKLMTEAEFKYRFPCYYNFYNIILHQKVYY